MGEGSCYCPHPLAPLPSDGRGELLLPSPPGPSPIGCARGVVIALTPWPLSHRMGEGSCYCPHPLAPLPSDGRGELLLPSPPPLSHPMGEGSCYCPHPWPSPIRWARGVVIALTPGPLPSDGRGELLLPSPLALSHPMGEGSCYCPHPW